MKLKLKSFNSLIRNKTSKKIRNLLNIKPSHLLFDYSKTGYSVSDGFFWRVDRDFKTIFKYSDILNIFYGEKTSNVLILFYDDKFNLIKTHRNNNINDHNSLVIDQEFLKIEKGFGSFFIFHEIAKNLNTNIRNSCYTGYSFKNSLPSFVHGNLHSASKSFTGNKIEFGLGASSVYRKYIYQVQNNMKFDKTEIILINNCNSKIKIDLNFLDTELDIGQTKIIDTKDNNIVKIKSNSMLIRPIIFNYRDNYIDVYHG